MTAQTPRELAQRYEQSFNARDLAGIVALYEPGALVTRPRREVRGIADIETAFRETLAQRVGVTLRLVDVRALQMENLCLTISKWAVEQVSGGTVHHRTATTIEVSRRQVDGTWKYVIDDPFSLNELSA